MKIIIKQYIWLATYCQKTKNKTTFSQKYIGTTQPSMHLIKKCRVDYFNELWLMSKCKFTIMIAWNDLLSERKSWSSRSEFEKSFKIWSNSTKPTPASWKFITSEHRKVNINFNVISVFNIQEDCLKESSAPKAYWNIIDCVQIKIKAVFTLQNLTRKWCNSILSFI